VGFLYNFGGLPNIKNISLLSGGIGCDFLQVFTELVDELGVYVTAVLLSYHLYFYKLALRV